MCTIAGALGTYARDAEPLARRLDSLKKEAESFRSKVAGDEKWNEDGDLTDQNLERRNKIAEVWAQFQDVETAAHAKIVALVGGHALIKDDGSHAAGMYGYDAEALKQSKSLPWGDAVEESVPAWQVWEHAWDFGKGFVVDGIGGTLAGLGGLVGYDGWDTFKASWTGLAKLSTATAITSIPGVGPLFFAVPDDKLPSWLRESRTAMKETGKALLAWDQWGSNPSRAAGAVTFNVITTICTGGTGAEVSGAGKAGAVAKALSVAGKTGKIVDPMTYVFKGAGAGISKISDVMAGLKNMGKFETPNINVDGAIALPDGAKMLPDGAIHLPSGTAVPDGAVKLPDGNIKLPDGTTTFPPGTVKLPKNGAAQFMDPDGNIYNADGTLKQDVKNAPTGKPNAGADTPRVDAPETDAPATAKVPEMAGAGARGGDGAIRLGSDISDPLHPADHTPGTHPDTTPGSHAPDNMPRNSADSHTPNTGRHAENSTGTGHSDGPGGDNPLHPNDPTLTGRHAGDLSSGGRAETPSGDGLTDTPTGGGHGDGPNGSGGLQVPDGPNGPGSWQQPVHEIGPLERGGDLEQQIRDQLRGTKVKHSDVDAILKTMSESPAGKEMADTIASGRFRDAEGFSTVVSNLVRPSEIPGSLEAMRLGNRLHESGVTDVSFELKQDGHEIKPGVFTEKGTDLDVLARDANGDVHGWQFKDMTGEASPNAADRAVKRIFKSIHQLTDSHADAQTFVIDTKIAKGEMLTQFERLQEKYDTRGVQFVIRTPDGIIFVPRDGKFTPEVTP
ncbi:hypothetical protein AB0I68_30640 [Streptomyces sp. NPDC050448]|uniref:hypothetical protein n=1 Tax=Streptomyces sp. NPDC050448 TaxID=3155404 RepID=UPI003412FA89